MTAQIIGLPDPNTYAEKVAAKVRGIAAEKQVKSKELANVLDVSTNAMSRRMTGKLPFGIDELALVAATLEVSVQEFLPQARPNAPRRNPDEGGNSGAHTIWSRLAPVIPIRPGMTEVTIGGLPLRITG